MKSLSTIIYILIGGLIGYLLLHPISMFIFMGGINIGIFVSSFSPKHMTMAAYFFILGSIIGTIVYFLQMKLLQQKLRLVDQNILLKQTISEKETLTRMLSHDLANPIGTSKNLLELMKNEPDSFTQAEVKENTIMIINSLSQACTLIDVSRKLIAIESGKIEMELNDYSLIEIIKEAGDSYGASCLKKGLSINYDFPNSSVVAKVEPVIFMYTIICNLLSNAIKFSDINEKINIGMKKVGDKVEINIMNIGPAIPPNKIDSIFSHSDPTTTEGTSGERGTGFGLPLVHKFVKLMHGEIYVKSDPNTKENSSNKTTFVIVMPTVDSSN